MKIKVLKKNTKRKETKQKNKMNSRDSEKQHIATRIQALPFIELPMGHGSIIQLGDFEICTCIIEDEETLVLKAFDATASAFHEKSLSLNWKKSQKHWKLRNSSLCYDRECAILSALEQEFLFQKDQKDQKYSKYPTLNQSKVIVKRLKSIPMFKFTKEHSSNIMVGKFSIHTIIENDLKKLWVYEKNYTSASFCWENSNWAVRHSLLSYASMCELLSELEHKFGHKLFVTFLLGIHPRCGFKSFLQKVAKSSKIFDPQSLRLVRKLMRFNFTC